MLWVVDTIAKSLLLLCVCGSGGEDRRADRLKLSSALLKEEAGRVCVQSSCFDAGDGDDAGMLDVDRESGMALR